jgi:GT2 family glycosyltransferase
MTRPQLSVIVPVRDDAEGIRRLLAGLDRQTLPRSRFEVLVVANGCRDGSTAAAAAGRARVIEDPKPSRARARNLGARAAAADRFAFIDADCVPSPGWLAELSRCAAAAPLIAGPVFVTTSPVPGRVERFERRWRFAQEAWVRQGWAATANLLVERRAFEAIGGFDRAYRQIGEDADLCLRAGRAGYALGYCAEAVVSHPAEQRLWPMLERFFWHGYSSAQVLARLGEGERAWRHPRALVSGGAALARLGIEPDRLEPAERRAMTTLARAAHAARSAGSLYNALRKNAR